MKVQKAHLFQGVSRYFQPPILRSEAGTVTWGSGRAVQSAGQSRLNLSRRGTDVDRTTQAAQQQIAAMGAQIFEVGLFKPSAADEGRAVMIPRTWDGTTLMRSIPWLRLQNAEGRNIYVRPKGEHDLSLVDDLSADAVRRMKSSGYAPAAIVETSPGNFQAWLKHPHQLPRELSTLAARKLAETFGGDRGAADWRHSGRLAGFTNRKQKYMNDGGSSRSFE